MSRLAICAVLLVFASSASSQVFYEPVEYQYDAGGTKYYYGGSNPAIHQHARQPYAPGANWGRTEGFAFVSADTRVHREVVTEPERIFTDATRWTNARILGYTIDDARNEAYANASRHFVKRDVPGMAVHKDGRWQVPPTSTLVRVFKSSGEEITPKASTMPKPLLIIPKDALQRPRTTDNKMVRAD